MKNIEYKGVKYKYKIICTSIETLSYPSTIFYENEPIIKYRRKYYLFGPKVKYEKYVELFRIEINIEDEIYSPEYIRGLIEHKIKLLNRKKEIERGDII